MSSSLIRAGLALLFAALTAAAQAQTFPSKPIRLICPFPPGGAVDIASRAIAAEMSKTLGQPVTVENRPGAGGNIGGAEVARAAPDGYTMLMTTSGIQAINPVLYPKMQYDPNKDLTPVAALVSLSNVLVVHPAVKANSVAELTALAKPSPASSFTPRAAAAPASTCRLSSTSSSRRSTSCMCPTRAAHRRW